MRFKKIWVVLGTILLVVGGAAAQDFWMKKEWKQWSKQDCRKMLEDSPWAQRWAQAEVKMAEFSKKYSDRQAGAEESRLEIWYVIQFRSARPIREAVVRQAMIEQKYDKMEPKGQEAFDKQVEQFLKRDFSDRIIVHVNYGSNLPEYERDLAAHWQQRYPSGVVPAEAYLTGASGKKVSPIEFISPKGGALEFELIFPRVVEGQPLITPDTKGLGVEFFTPRIGRLAGERVYTDFKVSKMMLNGQLVY